jgi:hypothetical protein
LRSPIQFLGRIENCHPRQGRLSDTNPRDVIEEPLQWRKCIWRPVACLRCWAVQPLIFR